MFLSHPFASLPQEARESRSGRRARSSARRGVRPPRPPQLEWLEERTVPTVLTTTNYNGLNFGQTATIQGGTAAIPPDPQGAVGPFSYIETVNLSVAIFDPNTSSVNPTTDS